MKRVPLQEVATIDREGIDPASAAPDTVYLGLEHIERGGRIIGHDTVAGAKLASTKFVFTAHHVLFGKLRPNLGKVCRPEFSGVCSTDILPIRPGPNLDRNYLAHFLSQPAMVRLAASQATGVNLPRLSPAQLAKFTIPLPPLDEQRRIAAVLDTVDGWRRKRLAATSLMNSLNKSIFRQMFGNFSDQSTEWPIVSLGDLIAMGPQNGLYRPSCNYGSGFPIVRIDSFQNGSPIAVDELKRVRIPESDSESYSLHNGDIVINRVNARTHLGKATVVTGLVEKTVFESNMMRLRLDTDRVLPDYVGTALQTPYLKSQIQTAAKDAVNQSSINQKDVKSLRIPVPPITLQQNYIRLRQRTHHLAASGSRSLAELNSLFDTLQSLAFRGELR